MVMYANSFCSRISLLLAGMLFLFTPLVGEDMPIYFLHIPKTGGVTVMSLFFNETDKKPGAFDTRHSTLYEVQRAHNLQKKRLVTFLREPVARVISEHRYILLKHKGTPRHYDLHRLPKDGDPLYTANNEMCKFLSGLDSNDPLIPIDAHLQAAKMSLDRFYFVGITEKMDESIALLFSGLGWPIPEKIQPFNVTKEDEELSCEVLEGIGQRNWADVLLYEYALEFFERQKERFVINTSSPEEPLSDNVHFTFDLPIRGYGWAALSDGTYKREGTRRWTDETNEAAIDFWLKAGHDYEISLDLYIPPIFYDNFSISANGIPLDCYPEASLAEDEQNHSTMRVRAILPKTHVAQDKATRFVFKLNAPSTQEAKQLYQRWIERAYRGNCQRGHFACETVTISAV